jgi:translocation and assembly module TamA
MRLLLYPNGMPQLKKGGCVSGFMLRLFVVLAWLVYPLPIYALDLAVKVDGLEKKLEHNVLAYLSVEQERQRESLNEARLRLLHDKAEEEIKAALRPFGYFDVKVIPSMSKVGEGYKVLYKVDPGSVVKFSDVDYKLFGEGADDPQLQKVVLLDYAHAYT